MNRRAWPASFHIAGAFPDVDASSVSLHSHACAPRPAKVLCHTHHASRFDGALFPRRWSFRIHGRLRIIDTPRLSSPAPCIRRTAMLRLSSMTFIHYHAFVRHAASKLALAPILSSLLCSGMSTFAAAMPRMKKPTKIRFGRHAHFLGHNDTSAIRRILKVLRAFYLMLLKTYSPRLSCYYASITCLLIMKACMLFSEKNAKTMSHYCRHAHIQNAMMDID